MRYLALSEVVELHRRLLEATGGAAHASPLGLQNFLAFSDERFALSIMVTGFTDRGDQAQQYLMFLRVQSQTNAGLAGL
jgi:hypothetical protein